MGRKSNRKPTKEPTPSTPPKKKAPEVVVEDEGQSLKPVDLEDEEEGCQSETNLDGTEESSQASEYETLSENQLDRQLLDCLGKDSKLQLIKDIIARQEASKQDPKAKEVLCGDCASQSGTLNNTGKVLKDATSMEDVQSKHDMSIPNDQQPLTCKPSDSNANTHTQQPKKTFASLFQKNRSEEGGMKLHFVDLGDTGDVVLTAEDMRPMNDIWGPCLVGCFTGRFPGLDAIQKLVHSWKVTCQFLPHHKGWVVFKFVNETDRDKVLFHGEKMINNKKLMLHLPEKGFDWSAKSFSTMPVWVLLHDMPMQLWSHQSISKVASKLGKPLFTDHITNQVTCLLTEDGEDTYRKPNYCRVLVNMDLSLPPPTSFTVTYPGGSYTQRVEYEDLPLYCYHCETFGHTCFECKELKKLDKRKRAAEAKGNTTLLDKDVDQPQATEATNDNPTTKVLDKGKVVRVEDGETDPSPSYSKPDEEGFVVVGKGKVTQLGPNKQSNRT